LFMKEEEIKEAKSFFRKSNGRMDKGTGRAMESRFRCLFS